MHGVRKRIPEFPLKKYRLKKGKYFLSEDVDTYINLKKIDEGNKASIVSRES